MSEEVEFCLDAARESMQQAIMHLEKGLQKIRAGKASPQMVEGVKVDCYGALTPMNQVANIHTPDPKTLVIQPWDKSMISPIEKAIQAANLGFNPVNDGELVRILVPPLTEERRRDLVKQVKNEGENTKIGIRNSRRSSNDEAKQLQKDGTPEDAVKKLEKDIQDLTNEYIDRVDKIVGAKEKEILTV